MLTAAAAAAAAASSTLVQSEVALAAIVQTDAAKLPPLPLPPGIRSRYVPNINGLTFHVLEDTTLRGFAELSLSECCS